MSLSRALLFSLVLSLSATFLASQDREISPTTEVKISQTEAIVLYPADFVVAEDGVVFLTDAQDGNIKCYEPDGRFLKAIGRRGPGPGEFLGPVYCDYQAPLLSVLDTPKFKVHIYERKGRAELVKIAEISCMACTSDVILLGKGVLVDAYVHNNDGKFALTLRCFDDTMKCLLPNYRRYGFESEREHKVSYLDLSMLTSQRGFLSVLGNRIYFVFDARPIVTSLNLDGSEIATFRTMSPNYREPRINARIRDAFAKPGREDEVKAERNKVSKITGILTDEDMIGILFSNYDATSDTWRLYLQRFAKGGKLISESLLRDAVNYGSIFSYYYQRESGILYVMAERFGDETDDYRILGYQLR